MGDTGKTVQDILQAEKSPLPDTFKVTDANGQEFQLLVNIDDRFAPTGQYSVSVLTSATAKEAIPIKSSLQTGTLDGASKETPITEITSVTINGKSIQAKVGIYQEVPNEGAFQINADGSYFFEPYHNGSSFSFTAKVGGEEKTASLSNINTTYSNDLLGTIKGTLVGVPDGEVTLRLYVNKQSKDDTAEVQYGPDSYPNGSDVKVTVTGGQWSISPEQLRQVLNDIWYADRLRGDDEIYLEVKMVDPVTGHTSEASTRYTFIADSQAPMAVQVGYQDATTSQTEHGVVTALIQGNLSLDKGIYANQGDAVKVFYNGQEVGTGTVGDFSITVTGYRDIKITLNKDLPLNGEAFNPELVKVYVTDTAGNTGVSINDNSASERAVESNMPKPVITAYLDNVGADGKAVEESAVQTIPNGGFTNDNNGGIKGTITIPDGGYSVDEIWLFFHGLGPYKITVPNEIKYAQSKPVTWEWEIKDTDHQFDQLTTTGKLAEGAINIMARAYNATQDKLSEASDIFTVYIDTRAPTVSIKVADSTLTLNETTQVTFTFDEKPQGFDENDIEVTGGKISDLKQSSTNPLKWTATFTPDPNTETTTASIKVKGASYTDVAGNNGKEGSSTNIIIDTHKPENTMPPELSLQEDASWSDFSVSVKEGNLANVKVSVEHGQLNITVPSGVTITEGANGSSSLTLKGSDINTALASLKYQPNSHWSGGDKLTVVSTDNYGQSSTDTTAIKVTAVADTPTLKLTAPEPVDNTTVSDVGGISANYYAVSGGSGGTGMSPKDLIAAFEQATVRVTGVITKFASYDYFDENGARQDPYIYKPDGLSYPTLGYKGDPYHSVKVTGLIYLEEGVTYTFGGRVDDAAVMVIGDQIVTYGMWVRGGASGTGGPSDKTPDGLGNVGGTFSGTYTPEKSGYYQFSFYAHNGNGGGGYTFLYKKGDEATHVISTDTATIFNSVEAAEAAGVHLSDLQAGGFYDVLEPNEVTAGHKIQLSTIDAKLVDTDGSETLTIWLEGVPVGVKISDGEHTFEAGAGSTKVDITSWKLDSLTFEAPQNMAAGTVQLTVRAVATEKSNGSMAEKVDTMNVKVDAHDQLLASFVPNGASALDKLSAWTAKDAQISLTTEVSKNNRLQIIDPSAPSIGNGTSAVVTSTIFDVVNTGSPITFNWWTINATANDHANDQVIYRVERLDDTGNWVNAGDGLVGVPVSALNGDVVTVENLATGQYHIVFEVQDNTPQLSGGKLTFQVDNIVLKAPTANSEEVAAARQQAPAIDHSGNESVFVDEVSSTVDLGDGYDKMVITQDGVRIDMQYIHNVEELHLQSAGEQVNIRYADLVKDHLLGGSLKIFGDRADKVDLGANGDQKDNGKFIDTSVNSATANSTEETSNVDNSSDADKGGAWMKNGTIKQGGTTFDVYQYQTSTGTVDIDHQLLIQQGVIIL